MVDLTELIDTKESNEALKKGEKHVRYYDPTREELFMEAEQNDV